MAKFRNIGKVIPTFFLALALALVVWMSAVTAADPTEEDNLPYPVSIEIIGQDSGLIITSDVPDQVNLTLRAPSSIWTKLNADSSLVRAVVDLSGLGAGTYSVPVQIQIGIHPVEVVSFSPASFNLVMETIANQSFTIQLVQTGRVAIGYQAGDPLLNQTMATISGPASLVELIHEVRATLSLEQAEETINQVLILQPLDANGSVVRNVTVTPDRVGVSVPIEQRGGYRNVVVKVVVSGQILEGYKVTNISVFPPAVTVFSADPQLVEDLPGFVETAPLDLTDAKDDLDVRMVLDLPEGVQVVGEQTVSVQVGIAAIEGSVTLSAMPVEVIGLEEGYTAVVSPENVDVVLSGPLPILDQLLADDIRVVVDMSGEGIGTYQREPEVVFNMVDLRVESILPASLEVVIQAE
jgi:YbbR domain-containing protein